MPRKKQLDKKKLFELADGKTFLSERAIAQKMGCSQPTINYHLKKRLQMQTQPGIQQ